MPQILPSQPTFAGQFGAGLSQSLAQLVENKVSQMHAQQNQQRLGSTLQKLGYTPEQSELLSSLPQKDLLSALQSLAPSQATQASQQLAQIQPESEQGPSLQNALQQLKAQTPEVSGMELLKQAGSQKLGEIGLGQKQAQQPGFAPLNAQELFEQARLQGITLTPEQQQKINNKVAAINASEDLQKQLQSFIAKQSGQKQATSEIAQTQVKAPEPLLKKPLTASEKLKEREYESRQKERAYKATEGIRNEIDEQDRQATRDLFELNRLEKLEGEKLESSGYYEFLKRSGFDIPALMNPASQEYEKISTGFVRNGKDIFGNRITDNDLNLLLKQIPTLSMSPGGRHRVRTMMKYVAEGKKIRAEIADKIIEENNGIPPFDFQRQISKKANKKLDSLALKIQKELSKPVPKGQDKLVTAIQAGLGDIVGAGIKRAPGAISGAAKGAILGSAVPGLGTGVGAALGALGGGTGLI